MTKTEREKFVTRNIKLVLKDQRKLLFPTTGGRWPQKRSSHGFVCIIFIK